jgi:hypothetical protein
MRLFIRLTAAVSVFLTMLIAGATLVGYLFPYPARPASVELALCEGSPCAMGLTVGQTAWADVYIQHPSTDDDQVFIRLSATTSIHFFASGDGQTVGRGYLNFRSEEETLPIGYIVAWYGEPCGLSFYPRSRNVVVRYAHTQINMRTTYDMPFSPHTPARSIHWADGDASLCDNDSTRSVISSEWRGFNLRAYGF